MSDLCYLRKPRLWTRNVTHPMDYTVQNWENYVLLPLVARHILVVLGHNFEICLSHLNVHIFFKYQKLIILYLIKWIFYPSSCFTEHKIITYSIQRKKILQHRSICTPLEGNWGRDLSYGPFTFWVLCTSLVLATAWKVNFS